MLQEVCCQAGLAYNSRTSWSAVLAQLPYPHLSSSQSHLQATEPPGSHEADGHGPEPLLNEASWKSLRLFSRMVVVGV